MEPGYLLDHAHGAVFTPAWVAGEPQYGTWITSLKLWKKQKLAVLTFRCPACGLLESYAPGGKWRE
jgi:hypothetical protein